MPLYSIAGNPLLSTEAAALSPEALEAHNIVAEEVLGLVGTTYTGDEAVRAAHAVALQVNYQVSLPPSVWSVKEEQVGPLKTVYRDNLPPVNPFAASMVSSLLIAVTGSAGVGAGWARFGPRR